MKTTAERLSEVYCRPKTEEEWVDCIPWLNGDPMLSDIAKTSFFAFGDGTISKEPNEGINEIPVTHFIDLLQDKIVPWRLEEDGFSHNTPMIEVASYPMGNITVCFHEGNVSVILDPNDSPWHSHICKGCKTYTELLTLIKLIG